MVFLLQGYSTGESVLKLIGLILLCVIIIAASYFTTKFVGKRGLNVTKSSNFEAIDAYRINQNKYLQLMRVGKKYIVFAVDKNSITFITELNEEDVILADTNKPKMSFKEILAQVGKKNDGKEEPTEVKDEQAEVEEEQAEAKDEQAEVKDEQAEVKEEQT